MKKIFEEKLILVIEILFFIAPFVILLPIAFIVILYVLQSTIPNAKYSMFIGAIGLTATLSGLSFGASGTSDDKKKKNILYETGENFFHATILFIVALTMQYLFSKIGQLSIYDSLKAFLQLPMAIIIYIFFMFGVILVITSLADLHHLFSTSRKKPI